MGSKYSFQCSSLYKKSQFFVSITGLSKKPDINQEPECCDVRWDQKSNNVSHGTLKRTQPSCQHTSVTSSGATRLGHSRLKLCLLVLVLLHTVATMTANQNSTCLTTIFPLDDNAPREEWLDQTGLDRQICTLQCISHWACQNKSP